MIPNVEVPESPIGIRCRHSGNVHVLAVGRRLQDCSLGVFEDDGGRGIAQRLGGKVSRLTSDAGDAVRAEIYRLVEPEDRTRRGVEAVLIAPNGPVSSP